MLKFTCIDVPTQLNTSRTCPVFGSVNKTKQITDSHTFNCTELQVCLEIILHKDTQVQDSQCIAQLGEEYSQLRQMVMKSWYIKRCRQAKTGSPLYVVHVGARLSDSQRGRKQEQNANRLRLSMIFKHRKSISASHKSNSRRLVLCKYWL